MHNQYLRQALQLAEIRRGFCAPNPSVGAVIVKNNKVLATGYHFASGYPHAEVDALNKIGDEAGGATIYVTLEPCCHFGKTPPCTDLLIQRGIKQVVYGMRDLNPQVAEKSAAILQATGIEAIYLPLSEITEFYKSYNHWWQTKKPFVTAKLAISMDSKIAGPNGERIFLTGEAAQQFTHQQRKCSDAILTTAKTIRCDDPQLNVRLGEEIIKKPVYILDNQLTTPLNAKIFNTASRITIFYQKEIASKQIKIFEAKNIRCIPIDEKNSKLNLNSVLLEVGKDGMHDLWVEAGGTCFSAFIQENLTQKAYLYLAPNWIGEGKLGVTDNKIDIFKNAKDYGWKLLGRDAICEINY